MSADTVPILLDVPLSVIESLLQQHLLASLTPNGNGRAAPNGHHLDTKEAPAPVVTAATGAP